MSFRVHAPLRFTSGRGPLSIPTMSVFKDGSTQIALPRATLRDAGLPDLPGARFDVLIGEGTDEGFIAIRKGTNYKAHKVGNSETPTSVCIRTVGVGKARFPAKPVRSVTAENGMLVLQAPDGFPLLAPFADSVSPRAHTNGQALAA